MLKKESAFFCCHICEILSLEVAYSCFHLFHGYIYGSRHPLRNARVGSNPALSESFKKLSCPSG